MGRLRCALVFAVLSSLPASRASSEALRSDLLAVKHPVTAATWLRSHPNDTLQAATLSLPMRPVTGNPFCALASGTLQVAGVTLARRVFFRVPDPGSLRFSAGNEVHPELIRQCVLSEIVLESDAGSAAAELLLAQDKNDLSEALGRGEAFKAALKPYPLDGRFRWSNGTDWHRGGARWIAALDQTNGRFVATALTSAAQQTARERDRRASGPMQAEAQKAHRLAATTQLPTKEVQAMQGFIDGAAAWRQATVHRQPPPTPQIAAFLTKWIKEARNLSPDRRAAALYSADVLLAFLPLATPENPTSKKAQDAATAGIRHQLSAIGARFVYDELGATYAYERDWLQEALRVAPDSDAGQQAFLSLLDEAFHPGCCYSGYGFETVIERASEYLRDHPKAAINSEILLGLGDAYCDRIAVADDPNNDLLGGAAKFRPMVKKSFAKALDCYRSAAVSAPGSQAAKQALVKAWALKAGLAPTETRFVRLYD